MAHGSRTRYAVLGMLTLEPMTGYRLRESIAQSVGHFWRESFGQLYPTLRELEAEGLVEPGPAPESGRGASYAVTEAGRDVVRAWLAADVESVASDRNELLLKVFFGRHAGPGVIAGHLDRHRRALTSAHASYLALERAVLAEQAADRPYWLATVRHGLAMVAAGLTWTDETTAALRVLDEGRSDEGR